MPFSEKAFSKWTPGRLLAITMNHDSIEFGGANSLTLVSNLDECTYSM